MLTDPGSGFSCTPRSVKGAHNFLGNSECMDSIRQAKGELGQAPVSTPTLETNKANLPMKTTTTRGCWLPLALKNEERRPLDKSTLTFSPPSPAFKSCLLDGLEWEPV